MATLLINWVFYNPVGHLVEAIQHAHGYHQANRDHFSIHLLLNASTPVELAEALPWVERVHALDVAEVAARGTGAPGLAELPRRFDYVIADHRTRPGGLDPEWDEDELIRAQAVLHSLYPPDEYSKGWGDFWGRHDPPPTVGLPYERDAQLCLPIPTEARKFAARYSHEGPRVCVLPAGGAGAHRSPTPAAWQLVCRGLEAELPGACFYFTGATRSAGGRSCTRLHQATLEHPHLPAEPFAARRQRNGRPPRRTQTSP